MQAGETGSRGGSSQTDIVEQGVGHEAIPRKNGTDAPMPSLHPAVALHRLAPGAGIVPRCQLAQCVQSHIGLLPEPLEQFRQVLESQGRAGQPRFPQVVMMHDGDDRQIAIRPAARLGQGAPELGDLAGARQLGERAGFDQAVLAARRKIEETLLGENGSRDVIEGIERRHEPRYCHAENLFKRGPAGCDFFGLRRVIQAGKFRRQAGIGTKGFMTKTVLGDFQPAGLAGLDEVGHAGDRQGLLPGMRDDREGSADIVPVQGVQYRPLERMVADGGRIVETNGDVNHGYAPDRFR